MSYAIGVPEPLSVFVDTYGTGKIPDSEILAKGACYRGLQEGSGMATALLLKVFSCPVAFACAPTLDASCGTCVRAAR